VWNKTTPIPHGDRWFSPAWGSAFLGFSIGGTAAAALLGPVENVGAAAIGCVVAGGVVGAAQWLVLRRRLPLSALWVIVTAGAVRGSSSAAPIGPRMSIHGDIVNTWVPAPRATA
jgi:hypothetical protein